MDSSTVAFIQGIIALVVVAAVGVGGYAAIVATRAIWVKGEPGKLGDTTQIQEELEHLRQRVAELEGVPERMTELEERVDFSERMLAKTDQPERLKS